VIKHGHAEDAPRSRRPTKITEHSRSIVEGIIDENGHLLLCNITEQAKHRGTKIGKTTVDKIDKDAQFKLIRPCKKPF
jgi:transposase